LVWELNRTHAVPRIQPGDLVGLGQGGIVEGVVDEEIHRALEVDHRLADVDQLRCPFAHDMGPEQAPRIQREDQFQETGIDPMMWPREVSRKRATPHS